MGKPKKADSKKNRMKRQRKKELDAKSLETRPSGIIGFLSDFDKKYFTWRRAAAVTGLFLSSVAITLSYAFYSSIKEAFPDIPAIESRIQSEYGTLDSPKALVKSCVVTYVPSISETTPVAAYINSSMSGLKVQESALERKLNDFEARLPEAKKSYDPLVEKDPLHSLHRFVQENIDKDPDFKPDEYEKLIDGLRTEAASLNCRLLYLDSEMIIGAFGSEDSPPEKDFSNYGSFIDCGNDVFRQLTGIEVPASLKVMLMPDSRDIVVKGMYDFTDNTIKVVDAGFIEGFIYYCHELGHAAYLGSESALFDLYNHLVFFKELRAIYALNGEGREKVLEEAAAFLFSGICCDYLKSQHPELAEHLDHGLFSHRLSFVEDYSQGEEIEEHACGWALAEVLANHFKRDYAEAFNYLSGINSFSRLPDEVIDNYKMLRESLPDEKMMMKEGEEKMRSVIERMHSKVESLLYKYEPPVEKYDIPLIDLSGV